MKTLELNFNAEAEVEQFRRELPDGLRKGDAPLNQYFTPVWAAEMLFDAHFPDLGASDCVWDPSAGTGATLAAIPAHLDAFGTEIDPALAELAIKNTGREVIVGDFCAVELPRAISAVFGNPPFEMSSVDSLLDRCVQLLPNGGRCGLLLPAYAMQTSGRVLRWNRHWTIAQEILPRDLFPGMSKPLIFATYTKDEAPRLIGFRLFTETREIRDLPAARQDQMATQFSGPRSIWRNVVREVLSELGGMAPLSAIYDAISGRRPTGNTHWKEQIRKVLQNDFVRCERGVYGLAAA